MTSLELIVSQDPAGETSHVIVADGVVVDTLVAVTADLDVIRITPEEPWTGLTSLVIRTEASPSWVGWREIEVQGLVTGEVPAAAPDVIFVGGPVLTMSSLGTVEAVAVTDDLISAVGTEADVLATAGAETEVVELEGRALMPGFVDPHTPHPQRRRAPRPRYARWTATGTGQRDHHPRQPVHDAGVPRGNARV